MTFTLRSRLTLLYTVLFGVLLAVIAAVSYHVLAYQLDADVSANLTELTTGLHGYLRFPDDRPTVIFDQTDPAQAAFVEEATRYYQVFNARTGELIVQSDALRPLGLEFTPAEVRQFGDRPVSLDLDTDYGRIRLSNSVLTPAASQTFLLQVGVSLAPMDAALKRFFILLVMSVPAGLIVTFVIGRWMAGVALRPLMRLADVARSIDIGDLRPRLPIRGARDELDVVATAFNDTLGRLQHAVGEMRQFSTALAHELRTPLAALRGDVEMAMRQSGGTEEAGRRFASQLEEIDKLKRLIDQVLTLARAEAGEIRLAPQAIDLGELARGLVDQLEPVAQAKGVGLRSEPVDARVVVDARSELAGAPGAQPGRQRDQVHASRRHYHGERSAQRGERAARRAGHRHRHRAGADAADLRTILPRGSRQVAGGRGRGPRPQPGEVDRRSPPRPHRGRQRARQGLDVHGLSAARR